MPTAFFTENRLVILKAALAGDLDKVSSLLSQCSDLIDAKTTTTAESLLHLASKKGHHMLCQLLLSQHHDPNPCDKAGNTPYQVATDEIVRKILVDARSRQLFEQILGSLSNEYFSIPRDVAVISGAELDALIPDPAMKGGAVFGMTLYRKGCPINVFFREDIVMTPYYGELLVAHEGEQVRQALEMFESNIQHPQEEIEARAFTKCLNTALSLFPEIMVYPPCSPSPQIREAQKMVVRYAVIGFIAHYKECSEESVERVKKLEGFEQVLKHASFVFGYDQHPEFRDINVNIFDEMTKKYPIKEKDKIPSLA